ncbi:MAG: hypothetical protein ABSA65_14925 [Acidimicrobiales bacterium]|jgi:multidrug resistance efflux pump
MTRTVEEVEADFAAADAAWSAAREAARLARLAAEDLRRRAIADDSTVSAAALAEAEHESEFAQLKIEARRTATEALESELRTAKAEQFADDFEAAIEPLRADFDQSLVDLESALGRVVDTWRAHAGLMERTYETAARIARDASPRIRFPQYGTPSVGKFELRARPVYEPVERLVTKSLGTLNTRR